MMWSRFIPLILHGRGRDVERNIGLLWLRRNWFGRCGLNRGCCRNWFGRCGLNRGCRGNWFGRCGLSRGCCGNWFGRCGLNWGCRRNWFGRCGLSLRRRALGFRRCAHRGGRRGRGAGLDRGCDIRQFRGWLWLTLCLIRLRALWPLRRGLLACLLWRRRAFFLAGLGCGAEQFRQDILCRTGQGDPALV